MDYVKHQRRLKLVETCLFDALAHKKVMKSFLLLKNFQIFISVARNLLVLRKEQ